MAFSIIPRVNYSSSPLSPYCPALWPPQIKTALRLPFPVTWVFLSFSILWSSSSRDWCFLNLYRRLVVWWSASCFLPHNFGANEVLFRKSFPTIVSCMTLSMFSSNSLRISRCRFRPLEQLELVFEQGN